MFFWLATLVATSTRVAPYVHTEALPKRKWLLGMAWRGDLTVYKYSIICSQALTFPRYTFGECVASGRYKPWPVFLLAN